MFVIASPWKTKSRGRLGTVHLLIGAACIVKKRLIKFSIEKNSWPKLESTWRSTVLSLPP